MTKEFLFRHEFSALRNINAPWNVSFQTYFAKLQICQISDVQAHTQNSVVGLVWEALGDFAQTYIPMKQHKCSNSLAAFWSPRSLPCLQIWIRPELLGSDFPLSAPLQVIYQQFKLHICSEEQKLHLSDKVTLLRVNIGQNTRKGMKTVDKMERKWLMRLLES